MQDQADCRRKHRETIFLSRSAIRFAFYFPLITLLWGTIWWRAGSRQRGRQLTKLSLLMLLDVWLPAGLGGWLLSEGLPEVPWLIVLALGCFAVAMWGGVRLWLVWYRQEPPV
jgi:hypothetical protein